MPPSPHVHPQGPKCWPLPLLVGISENPCMYKTCLPVFKEKIALRPFLPVKGWPLKGHLVGHQPPDSSQTFGVMQFRRLGLPSGNAYEHRRRSFIPRRAQKNVV